MSFSTIVCILGMVSFLVCFVHCKPSVEIDGLAEATTEVKEVATGEKGATTEGKGAATEDKNDKHVGAMKTPGTDMDVKKSKNELSVIRYSERLEQTIKTLKQALGELVVPDKFNGFNVNTDGHSTTLSFEKIMSVKERVLIRFNVKGSMTPDGHRLRSKPNFIIEIEKEGTTLELSCYYNDDNEFFYWSDDEDEDAPENELPDKFYIDSVRIYPTSLENRESEKIYSTAGDIMDRVLYHFLMEFLKSKGIGDDFVSNMAEFSSMYERNELYLQWLEHLQMFIKDLENPS